MTLAGEDAMRKTFVRAVGFLGLLCACAANAGITFTDIYVQQNYFQTGGGSYVDLMSSPLAGLSASLGANGPGGNAKIQFMVGVATPSDFTSITLSGPGFGSPQALGAPVLDGGQYRADYTDYGFASLAALNAKYPLGSTYTFTATASNPALNQTRTNPYCEPCADRQPRRSSEGSVLARGQNLRATAQLFGAADSAPQLKISARGKNHQASKPVSSRDDENLQRQPPLGPDLRTCDQVDGARASTTHSGEPRAAESVRHIRRERAIPEVPEIALAWRGPQPGAVSVTVPRSCHARVDCDRIVP
jgi:hypothetical protein